MASKRPTGAAVALAAAAALLVTAAAALAAVTFGRQVVDADGPRKAWGKGAGDVDGDGRVDLLVGGYEGGLYWYQNTGSGWPRAKISDARMEEDLEVVDLDKDGRRDVVAITFGGVTWFRNTPTGWAARTLVSGYDLHDLEVRDLDGDGKLDLAGRDQAPRGNVINLWRQSSPTVWTRSTIALPEAGTGLLAVDLDRDGKRDLAIAKYWFENRSSPGALSFVRHLYHPTASTDAYIAAGRLDGDERVDLVVAPAHPASGSHAVAWYKAPADRTRGWTRRVLEGGVQPVVHFAGVADFDRDGRNDVATAMTHIGTNPRIKLYRNLGDGRFAAPATIANASSHAMEVVDVDNNGLQSLFGADYNDTPRTPVELWRARAAP